MHRGPLAEILDRTDGFPKRARFTFSTRIDNLALDVMERIAEARYTPGKHKQPLLKEIDLCRARLRVLLRISHGRRFLSTGALEHLACGIDRGLRDGEAASTA